MNRILFHVSAKKFCNPLTFFLHIIGKRITLVDDMVEKEASVVYIHVIFSFSTVGGFPV